MQLMTILYSVSERCSNITIIPITCRSTQLASDDDYITYELSHVNSPLVTTRHGIS